MLKTILYVVAMLILVLVASTVYRSCENSHYRYQIDYSHGKYPGTDYTDKYRLDSNRIEYDNQFGKHVIRCGSFSVQENADYSPR